MKIITLASATVFVAMTGLGAATGTAAEAPAGAPAQVTEAASPAQAAGLPGWPVVRITEGSDPAAGASLHVATVQHLLNFNGANLDADGIFGTLTEAGVEAFQDGADLDATGYVDADTWRALIAEVTEGDSNDAVAGLQAQLNRYGYDLDVDGVFGPLTDAALRDFQAGHDALDEDGIADPDSWNALAGGDGDEPGIGSIPDGTSAQKVLFIDFDGIRYDKLLEADTPVFDALAAAGQFGPTEIHDEDEAPSVSGPGHSNNLTGVWPTKHQVLSNDYNEPNNLDIYPDFLTRLERVAPELSTFAIFDGGTVDNIIASPDLELNRNTRDAGGSGPSGRRLADWIIRAMEEQNPDVTFVTFIHLDRMGHDHGGASPQYLAGIELMDDLVGEILEAIESRPTYDDEDWLILLTTDHGHTDAGGHSGSANHAPKVREIWTIASGGGIPATDDPIAEWRQVDLVPTAIEHVGIAIDPEWDLDGVPIG